MKNAAKCDTSCELQNLVSHQNFERILHFRLRGSMSVGVSVHPHTFSTSVEKLRQPLSTIPSGEHKSMRADVTYPRPRPCSVGVRRARRSSVTTEYTRLTASALEGAPVRIRSDLQSVKITR